MEHTVNQINAQSATAHDISGLAGSGVAALPSAVPPAAWLPAARRRRWQVGEMAVGCMATILKLFCRRVSAASFFWRSPPFLPAWCIDVRMWSAWSSGSVLPFAASAVRRGRWVFVSRRRSLIVWRVFFFVCVSSIYGHSGCFGRAESVRNRRASRMEARNEERGTERRGARRAISSISGGEFFVFAIGYD